MAPSPNGAIDATQTFAVYRILPNQNETLLATQTVPDGATTTSVIAQTAATAARQQRTNNPSWRIVIYGPVDPPATWYTNDDRIWDSATDL